MAKLKLPVEAKWIIIALVAVVVGVVAYFIYSSAEKRKKVKDSKEAVERANAEIDPKQLTITDIQAEAFADKIYVAVRGLGTDVDAIREMFDYCKTRSDIIKVAATYQSKSEKESWWFSSGNMWKDLAEDLNATERKEINKILEYKNVEFRI